MQKSNAITACFLVLALGWGPSHASELTPPTFTGRFSLVTRGLHECGVLVRENPRGLNLRHVALVTKALTDYPQDIKHRILDEARKEIPMRTTFELLHVGVVGNGGKINDSFLEWKITSRGFRALNQSAKSILDYEPFTTGNLLLFDLDPAKEGRGQYTSLNVLPKDAYPSLTEARDWRVGLETAFIRNQHVTEEAFDELRSKLKSPNCYIRLSALLRITELKRLTKDDAVDVLVAGLSTPEVGAATLVLLKEIPEMKGTVAELGAASTSKPMLMEGIALGAAIHFLDLNPKLLNVATTYQGFRTPGEDLPPELAETASYPVLSAIGDAVKPLRKSLTIAPETMLRLLLSTTRALHQTSTEN